jgi:hypothetical protein
MLSAESGVLHNIALPSYHWNQIYKAEMVIRFACVHLGQALDNPCLALTSSMQLDDHAKLRLNSASQR